MTDYGFYPISENLHYRVFKGQVDPETMFVNLKSLDEADSKHIVNIAVVGAKQHLYFDGEVSDVIKEKMKVWMYPDQFAYFSGQETLDEYIQEGGVCFMDRMPRLREQAHLDIQHHKLTN